MLLHCHPIKCNEVVKIGYHEDCDESLFDLVEFLEHVENLGTDHYAIRMKWEKLYTQQKGQRTKKFNKLSIESKIKILTDWRDSLMQRYSSEQEMKKRNEEVTNRIKEFEAYLPYVYKVARKHNKIE